MKMSAELWWSLVHIGLSHQFAIGPLFLLYFLSRTKNKFQITKIHFAHFIPFFVLLILTPLLEWPFWRYGGLWASYISILSYYLYSLWIYRKALGELPNLESLPWLKSLLIICGILLLAYSPALFKYVGYLGGSVLYAIGIYFVTIMVLGRDRFLSYFQDRYPGTSLDKEKTAQLIELIESKIHEEHIYLNADLSLSSLASELNTTANILSKVINSHYKKNFADFINSFRINKAKAILKDPSEVNLKIVAIAFDCGFNSLSTFNTVFKKLEGTAPNQYRKANNPAK